MPFSFQDFEKTSFEKRHAGQLCWEAGNTSYSTSWASSTSFWCTRFYCRTNHGQILSASIGCSLSHQSLWLFSNNLFETRHVMATFFRGVQKKWWHKNEQNEPQQSILGPICKETCVSRVFNKKSVPVLDIEISENDVKSFVHNKCTNQLLYPAFKRKSFPNWTS